MKRAYIAIVFLVSISTIAQNSGSATEIDLNDTEVPGSLVVDFGFNFIGNDNTDSLNFEVYGSRTFRIGYQYEMPLGNSSFSFNPGLAFSVEKYKFKDNLTLIQNNDLARSISLDTLNLDIIKSQISTSYLELPLELRWYQDKNNKQGSFKVAIGFKVGMRAGVQTKYKFNDSVADEKRVLKDKQSYQIRRWRYGVHGRIGIGSFNLYYYQSLTELFENGKGPGATTATPFQLGLTYEIF